MTPQAIGGTRLFAKPPRRPGTINVAFRVRFLQVFSVQRKRSRIKQHNIMRSKTCALPTEDL